MSTFISRFIYQISLRNIVLGICIGLVIVSLGAFLSYRLLDIPDGITADEAAFGLNGALLANTLRDQNGRLLPIFVLSLDGKDWRQPVTQYSAAVMFKLFGTSLYNLRFISILFGIASIVLIFYLLKLLFNWKYGFLGSAILLFTPIFFMHTHMGLDNIAPLPFVLVWLIGTLLYSRTLGKKYLVIAALALGMSIYSYKAMRLFVPIWGLVTICYIWMLTDKRLTKNNLKPLVYFSVSLAPFFLIMPLLELKYAGALTGGARASFDSWYAFLYPVIATFDPSFLFIKGDLLAFHSTGHHGMLLLSTLPLVLVGTIAALRKGGYWFFLLGCLLAGPLLFGLVGSIHRASRLIALLPFFISFSTLGIAVLWQSRIRLQRYFVLVVLFILVVNAIDFIQYYWLTYPSRTQNIFGGHYHASYVALGEEARKRNLTPYIEEDIVRSDADAGRFFSLAYLSQPLITLKHGQPLPKNGILLSTSNHLTGLTPLPNKPPVYTIHITNEK